MNLLKIGSDLFFFVLTTFILFCQIYQMALKESLDKFKKQQEMCQTTLSSIKANSKSTPRVTPYNPANAKSAAPAVKFSSDTERLQHINSIRKAPVGAQIKRVINLLLEVHSSTFSFLYLLYIFMPL